jgi:hypothetical protein
MGFGRWYNAQKAGMQIAVAGGIVVIAGGVVIGVLGIVGAGLARPGAPASTPAPAPALTTPASALVTSSPPAASAPAPPSAAAPTGTITGPRNGATNVSNNEQLLVSGAAQNIPAGYLLDVFLQFAGHTRYYPAANPGNPAPLINGHWSAAIFISEAQPVILWLVLLSPAELNVTNNELDYQSAGYPTLPGTTLASVSFTAKASP